MANKITADLIEESIVSDSEQPAAVSGQKQSLNLKVRARVGVETRTQLHAGSYGGSPTQMSGCSSSA